MEKSKKKKIDATDSKNTKGAICLDPEKLKASDRVKAEKSRVKRKIAATGDLSKRADPKNLDENLDESEIIEEQKYTEDDMRASYRVGLNVGLNAGLNDGDSEKKAFHGYRIKQATNTKTEQRRKKESYVLDEYRKVVNDKVERARIESMSESKMAAYIKARIEKDLSSARTSKHKPVLPRKVDRKGNVTFSGISIQTIIHILRNRDKTKLPFYPWEK